MFAHIKAFRWPIVAVSLITVVMLFTLQFDRVPVKSASSFDAASFISNEEHYKLQVQESGRKKKRHPTNWALCS